MEDILGSGTETVADSRKYWVCKEWKLDGEKKIVMWPMKLVKIIFNLVTNYRLIDRRQKKQEKEYCKCYTAFNNLFKFNNQVFLSLILGL